MIPRYMQCHHDPSIGAHGDCFRACVASLLELEVDDVPHFFDYAEDGAELGFERVQAFLLPRGLTYWQVSVPTAILHEVCSALGHHVLSGVDPVTRTDHAVVALAGRPVHNPDPRGGLVLEPIAQDGVEFYAAGVICVR